MVKTTFITGYFDLTISVTLIALIPKIDILILTRISGPSTYATLFTKSSLKSWSTALFFIRLLAPTKTTSCQVETLLTMLLFCRK